MVLAVSRQLPPLLAVVVGAEKPSVSVQPAAAQREREDMVSGSAEEPTAAEGVANLRSVEQEVVRLAIQAPVEGRLQEVEFDFNLDHDRPKHVRLAPVALEFIYLT